LAGDIGPAQILVTSDNAAQGQDLIIIGVSNHDRPGLLSEISKCLARMKLQCHRTEAAVVGLRSYSVWRCELLESNGNDLNKNIWESLKVYKSLVFYDKIIGWSSIFHFLNSFFKYC
jgi:UTP:GlnB (protein PII) uridylyltransferase